MTKKINKTIKAVMRKIKKHEVKMKPRAYFVLGSMLIGVGITAVLLVTILLVGVVFFRLRMQGTMRYLMMGRKGFRPFVGVFPWKVVGLAIASFLSGSWLLKKHNKIYKIGLGWLVLGAMITVVGLGFLIDKMGVNERLQNSRQLKPLYRMKSIKGEETVRPMMRRLK